jgi:opacity protein-like surface antigen
MIGADHRTLARNKGAVMRRLLVAAALIGLAPAAHAGEFEIPATSGSPSYAPSPFVPAPATYMRWSGFYGGAQAGYGNAHSGFAGATEPLVAFMLRDTALENEQHPSQWTTLGSRDASGPSGGGFVGYNSQWDDVILGVEVMYSKTNLFAQATGDPITRVTSAGGNTYNVTVDGDASIRFNDYGTARIRAGYVMKTIMPWMMAGVAVGRVDYALNATVSGVENFGNPLPCGIPAAANCTPFSFSKTDAKNNAFVYGWTVGGGVDVMVMPHVFLRAEYEYTNFTSLAGIKPALNTARLGAAFKF